MNKITIFIISITSFFASILTPFFVIAQPYGTGSYNINLPYGNQTSLSISTDGDIDVPITPTTDGVLATGASNVTVTSTDVKGYKLYIRALNDTNMNNLGALLPASANATPAALSVNTWGYNTDATSNFIGISMSDVLIRSVSSPVPGGSITTITYGIKLDLAKPAGKYLANVVYTAVPQTN